MRAFARQKGASWSRSAIPTRRALDARRAARAARAPARPLEELLAAAGVDAVVLATPAVAARRAGASPRSPPASTSSSRSRWRSRTADAEAVVAAADARAAARSWSATSCSTTRRTSGCAQLVARRRASATSTTSTPLRVNLGRLRQRRERAVVLGAARPLDDPPPPRRAARSTVAARGQAYLQPGVEDVVFVNLRVRRRQMAQIQLSWLDPRKERRLTVVGSRKMVEFDDAHPTEKLRIYDKGYDRPPDVHRSSREYLTVRHGDIHIPQLRDGRAARARVRHFLHCVRDRRRRRAPMAPHGLEVVRVLDAAQRSLRCGRQPRRPLNDRAPPGQPRHGLRLDHPVAPTNLRNSRDE